MKESLARLWMTRYFRLVYERLPASQLLYEIIPASKVVYDILPASGSSMKDSLLQSSSMEDSLPHLWQTTCFRLVDKRLTFFRLVDERPPASDSSMEDYLLQCSLGSSLKDFLQFILGNSLLHLSYENFSTPLLLWKTRCFSFSRQDACEIQYHILRKTTSKVAPLFPGFSSAIEAPMLVSLSLKYQSAFERLPASAPFWKTPFLS